MTEPRYVSDKLPGDAGSAPDFGRAFLSSQRDRLMSLLDDPGEKSIDIRHETCRQQLGVVARQAELGIVVQWYEKNLVRERIHKNGGWVDAPSSNDTHDRPLTNREPYSNLVVAIIDSERQWPPLSAWCSKCANTVYLDVAELIDRAANRKVSFQ